MLKHPTCIICHKIQHFSIFGLHVELRYIINLQYFKDTNEVEGLQFVRRTRCVRFIHIKLNNDNFDDFFVDDFG